MQCVVSKAIAFSGLVATLLASMCASSQVAGVATTAASKGPASMTLPRVVALTSADIDACVGVSEKYVEKGVDVRKQGFLETPGYSSCVTAASRRSA